MKEEIELTVTKPLTELQLIKDSSIQAVPLTNEEYEKALNSFDKEQGGRVMFWIVVSIILGLITILTLISNAQKSEKIAQLNYTIIYMASSDEDVKKALDEWERFKG